MKKENYFQVLILAVLVGPASIIAISNAYSAIPSEEFQRIVRKIADIYGPLIKTKRGIDLEINAKFYQRFPPDSARIQNDGTDLGKAIITITGQVAVHPTITRDAFALLVCHEFGHILGGNPSSYTRVNGRNSVEGQADYWAAAKCLKRFISAEISADISADNFSPVNLQTPSLPLAIINKCNRNFSVSTINNLLCQKTAMATIVLGDYFNATKNSAAISVVAYDQIAPPVKNTLVGYGSTQCRLNTFLSGAFCNNNFLLDENCTQGDGIRPDCWYRGDI
ncbi:MAG: hypothetical protein HQK53_04025 [Oligoflexia bacterium]|nr:hypothetical protein [Oligoflexia bacterium]